MADQTLIVILIAMLTLSWVAIAVVIVLIGIRIMRVLDEVNKITTGLRQAGESAAADIEQLREHIKDEGVKIRSVVDYALGFVLRRLPMRRRKKIKESEIDLT